MRVYWVYKTFVPLYISSTSKTIASTFFGLSFQRRTQHNTMNTMKDSGYWLLSSNGDVQLRMRKHLQRGTQQPSRWFIYRNDIRCIEQPNEERGGERQRNKTRNSTSDDVISRRQFDSTLSADRNRFVKYSKTCKIKQNTSRPLANIQNEF